MQFVDLAAQQRRIRGKIEENIRVVLDHGSYVMGPEMKELEARLAEYAGVRHALACASGTDALLLALMAYGIGPGDAVFTTPFTFIATAEAIGLLGATPVFVDIDAKTFNIDPEKLDEAITALMSRDPRPLNPKGIIAVDLFGLPADYDRIGSIAQKHGLFVMEDAAQSFGAEYKGRRACSLGHVSCTSFFPAKPLGCYGDGGMCFTDDDHLSHLIESLRMHGIGNDRYDNVRLGINGRMDTLQAAIVLAKFEIFPEEVVLRNEVAARYSELLATRSSLSGPFIPEGSRSVFAQYSILAESGPHRAAIQAKLKEAGVPTAIYYPKPLHLQGAFASLDYKVGAFPVSEECASRIFSLPMHPYLEFPDQERIVETFRR